MNPEHITTEVRQAWLQELMAIRKYGKGSPEHLSAMRRSNEKELKKFGIAAFGNYAELEAKSKKLGKVKEVGHGEAPR
jgi:hypothetical protein